MFLSSNDVFDGVFLCNSINDVLVTAYFYKCNYNDVFHSFTVQVSLWLLF